MEKTFLKNRGIPLTLWDKVESPKGVVQIAHGMAEHIERYDGFAKYLNTCGFIVVGSDHRAHGDNAPEGLGKTTHLDIFEDTVADLRAITRMAAQKYDLPVVLFGHSYGSFLAQRYLTYGTNGLSGAVLCGSALQSGLVLTAARAISSLGKGNPLKDGKIFANMTFNSYDKKIGEGKNAWLSRDKDEVEKYNNDSQCGFICSNGFYYSFFKGIADANKQVKSGNGFKILIMSGSKDQVGGSGKLVGKLAKHYKKAGYDVKLSIYEDARHEILNEIDKENVMADVLCFINSCIKTQNLS